MTSRVAAALLAVFMVLGLLLPGVAVAQPQDQQPQDQQPQRPNVLARLELADMSPRVVTVASAPVLRVTGQVVNVGDRPITGLGVRLQRDEPVTSEKAALEAVSGVPEAPRVTRFQPLPGELTPGQSIPFQLDVPLRGGADLESLQISEPGVYPLLVNLNGKPDFGGVARLASVPLLLPVLGIPPATPGGRAGPVLSGPDPPQPRQLTVVWPLAAEPARLPTGPGEPILIRADPAGTDPVAADIAPGGRLDGLLAALEQVVPPGSALAPAVCVAVDPLLLETVDGMSRGYRVARYSGTTEGTGAQDARSWLDRLRGAVQGRCVLPLPYADPDLVALSRAGLTDLQTLANSTGMRLVRDLLGLQPLAGVSWPPGEVLDERTLADLTALGTHAVLLDPRGVTPNPSSGGIGLAGAGGVVGLVAIQSPAPPAPAGPPAPRAAAGSSAPPAVALPGRGGATPAGLLVDPLLTSALRPADVPDPALPNFASRPRGTASALAAQDGLGALVYRAAVDPDRRPVILVPPRRWQARGTETTELLSTARHLLESGFFSPGELPALRNARPSGPTAAVNYPSQVGAEEIPQPVTNDVQRARDVLRDLQIATVRDATNNLEPADLFDPLRLGLLRGASSAWRGEPARAAQLIGEQRVRLDELRRSVRIVHSPGPYSLAAANSPLLITVSNELPIGVQVRLNLSETAGLRTGVVGLQLVPARSTRQLVIPAEVSRTGQLSVDAVLSTPGGTPLGEPSTLQLRATPFSSTVIELTAGAGAVILVLLVARGVVRRVRVARDTR